ncbi:MAG: NUDIX domain-containing protein [Desulfomonilaceae bacterium]
MKSQDSEEILDVINVHDEVIGSASRREIHAKWLFHRAVHIFVFDEAGNIYVQRRNDQKDSHPSKLDSSAAGHVDSGEDYFDAARRELLEELSLLDEIKEELRYGPDAKTDNERVVLYSCITSAQPQPNPLEIASGRFWNPQDLEKAMAQRADDFVPAFIVLWSLFKKKENESSNTKSI